MAEESKKWYENPFLGSLTGGLASGIGAGLTGQQDPALGNLHLVNPAQQALYNTMAKRLLGGGGDFGFGSAYKQGKGQVQQMMAQRGISPQSGVSLATMGGMTADAVGQDAANRRNTWFQLMGTPLQTAQTAGANYIPGSPSSGTTTEAQAHNRNTYSQRYGGEYGWRDNVASAPAGPKKYGQSWGGLSW